MTRCVVLGVITLSGLLCSSCALAPDYRYAPSVPPYLRHYGKLSDVTDTFASHLSQNIQPSKLYLNRTAVRDIVTRETSNFSAYLQNELESSLSQKGFSMVYDPADAQYLIGATYQKDQDHVRIFLKYHKADLSGLKSRDYDIALSRLPLDSFKEDLKSMAYKLAAPVLKGHQNIKVYITPIREGRAKYVSAFSESFTARVKIQLKQIYPQARIMDEKPLLQVRSILKKATVVENIQHSEAALIDADAVLEGEYFVEGRTVSVNLYLKSLKGQLMSSSTVDIPQSLISASLSDETSQLLSNLLDRPNEPPATRAALFTTKGGYHPVYYSGEKITFIIQVSEPLYVYLYNINPLGKVTLLYPYEAGMHEARFLPGRLYMIPPEPDQQTGVVFEFEAEPPFGKDAVKLFASRQPLALPSLTPEAKALGFRGEKRLSDSERKRVRVSLADRSHIHPLDIVDYYRGQALSLGVPVLEASLIIETRNQ
jgi:hypothetical protein